MYRVPAANKPALHRPLVHISAAFALAVGAVALATNAAHAQETFTCEDGGTVTVLPGQLELMKRTDPCVARHFGLSADPEAPLDPGASFDSEVSDYTQAPPAPASALAPVDAPLPVRRPETLMTDTLASDEAALPLAEVKSDYRHVHIINARPGAPQFYEHVR